MSPKSSKKKQEILLSFLFSFDDPPQSPLDPVEEIGCPVPVRGKKAEFVNETKSNISQNESHQPLNSDLQQNINFRLLNANHGNLFQK